MVSSAGVTDVPERGCRGLAVGGAAANDGVACCCSTLGMIKGGGLGAGRKFAAASDVPGLDTTALSATGTISTSSPLAVVAAGRP